MNTTERHRIKLLEYLSNPENDYPLRVKYAKILGVSTKTLYKHFTPEDMQGFENEAYEIRKKNSSRQRARLLSVLYKEGSTGKVDAIKEYMNRTEGKVPDKQEQSGPGGGPIEHEWRIELVEAPQKKG